MMIETRFLGQQEYGSCWQMQQALFNARVERKIYLRKHPEVDPATLESLNDLLLMVEHPPVYTLGKSGNKNNLLVNEEVLKAKGAAFFPINRGGDITFHGPGQLVCYPIFDLEHYFTDIHRYLRFLEEAVILTCREYGVESGRIDGLTGVWVDHIEQQNPRKICAMGVKASRWITMHGLALNVNTDLSWFDLMIPCGITDKAVTSLKQEVGRKLDLAEAGSKLARHITQLFTSSTVSI